MCTTLPNIFQKAGVIENRDGGLTVEKDPSGWDGFEVALGERETFVLVVADIVGGGRRGAQLQELDVAAGGRGGRTGICVVPLLFTTETGDVRMQHAVRPGLSERHTKFLSGGCGRRSCCSAASSVGWVVASTRGFLSASSFVVGDGRVSLVQE
jgi:hypothetical protein